MTAKKPIWSAARLNAELANNEGAPLAFMPYGEVIRLKPSANQIVAPSAEGSKTSDEPTRVADVAFLRMGRTETVQTNVSLMPPLLACLAIDPEPWSIFIIYPNAVDAVGPFRDISSPSARLVASCFASRSYDRHDQLSLSSFAFEDRALSGFWNFRIAPTRNGRSPRNCRVSRFLS